MLIYAFMLSRQSPGVTPFKQMIGREEGEGKDFVAGGYAGRKEAARDGQPSSLRSSERKAGKTA